MHGWVMYVAMSILAVVMLWARSQAKESGNRWARPLAAISGVLALATAIAQVIFVMNAPEDDGGIAERQQSFAAAAMRVLGEELGTHHSGAKVLIITPIETEYNKPYHDLAMAMLREGMGANGDIGERIPFGGNGEYDSNQEYTAADLDGIIAGRGDHNVIVSLLGLPANYTEMAFWDLADDVRPKLVLTEGAVYELRRAISADYISAVIVRNPEFRQNRHGPVPTDYRQAFDERFLLVTPRTIDDIAAAHSHLFMLDPSE